MLPLLLPFAAACTIMPPRAWPLLDQRTVRAAYRVAAATPIELPVSSTDLTILALAIEPPPQSERWQAGRRWIVPPDGCREVVVTCTYRAYARPGGVPGPAQLFPGAAIAATTP